jgi:hypothetical protein
VGSGSLTSIYWITFNSGNYTEFKTIIFPVVLYGCETWSLTLREEHRLRVFENRVLMRIFRLRRDEVMGETA